jgi:hypothetical protein
MRLKLDLFVGVWEWGGVAGAGLRFEATSLGERTQPVQHVARPAAFEPYKGPKRIS